MNNILTISDVHIKEKNCNNKKMLFKVIEQAKSKNIDSIFFLGDIFDLMIGSHQEHINLYDDFFQLLKVKILEGIKVKYFAGNHDLHLKSLFESFIIKNNLPLDSFEYHQEGIFLKLSGKDFYFSHGDDIEIGNYGYKIYKYILTSKIVEFLANKVFSYKFINDIGTEASKKSRIRNNNRYSGNNLEFVKEKFRKSAILHADNQKLTIVCGHSHVDDIYEYNNLSYYNNGYFPITKKYHLILDGNIQQFTLLDS